MNAPGGARLAAPELPQSTGNKPANKTVVNVNDLRILPTFYLRNVGIWTVFEDSTSCQGPPCRRKIGEDRGSFKPRFCKGPLNGSISKKITKGGCCGRHAWAKGQRHKSEAARN